jgi:hypothetical protein
MNKYAGLPLPIKVFFVSLIFLLAQSCERRSCTNVVCQPYETCFQGNCYCADGYEGANCATLSYQKFIGNYNVTETCNSSSPNFFNYTSFITQGNYINQIYLNGLFNMGVQAAAYIYNTTGGAQGTFVEIPYQQQGAFAFSGQGTFDVLNNRLTVTFNYTFNGGSYQCIHTFYKQ